MDPAFLERPVKAGLSVGQKKRHEILQMAILEPKLAILDETDPRFNIDALKIVARGMNALRRLDRTMILITHSSDDRAVHRTGIPYCPGWGVETYRVISIKVRAGPVSPM